MNEHNPLLQPWRTPFGLPPFDEIEPKHFPPAFEAAMAEHRREIDALVADPQPPFRQHRRGLRACRHGPRPDQPGVLRPRLGAFQRVAARDRQDHGATHRPPRRRHLHESRALRADPGRPRSQGRPRSGAGGTASSRRDPQVVRPLGRQPRGRRAGQAPRDQRRDRGAGADLRPESPGREQRLRDPYRRTPGSGRATSGHRRCGRPGGQAPRPRERLVFHPRPVERHAVPPVLAQPAIA